MRQHRGRGLLSYLVFAICFSLRRSSAIRLADYPAGSAEADNLAEAT